MTTLTFIVCTNTFETFFKIYSIFFCVPLNEKAHEGE